MAVNWADVLDRLRSYPASVQRFRPPCPKDRIEIVQQQLGMLPAELSDMLNHFNGAKLFDAGAGGSMVSLFGTTEDPPLPRFEWGVDWYIDTFTPAWRAAVGVSRQDDWVVAMMNYGDLIILDKNGTVREWDTAVKFWSPNVLSFAEWIEDILRQGDNYLKEE